MTGARYPFWLGLILALMLLGASFSVHAQSPFGIPTFPIPPCQDRATTTPLTVTVMPEGLPAPLAQYDNAMPNPLVCTTLWTSNWIGAAAAMWCPQPPGKEPILYMYAVRWSWLAQHAQAAFDFDALTTPGDLRMKIGTIAAKNVDTAIWDMCDVWSDIRVAINNSKPAVVPLPPAWSVKPNGAQTTRPAYSVINGSIKGPAGSAVIGQPCDITQPVLLAGVDKWAVFGPAFAPQVLTLCVKAP